MIWLANTEKHTSWAHHPWTAFRDLPGKERYLVVLPVFGFADHGLGLPLDVEEVVGSALLASAVARSGQTVPYRVLPPLRFGLAPYPSTFFGIDPETAHDLVREIAEGVQAAGFAKLVFFTTSPWQKEFVDTASRDLRIALGLQTFVIDLSGLGLSFHPTSTSRARLQALGSHLLNQVPGDALPADIRDAEFRPGSFRQPPPLASPLSRDEIKTAGAAELVAVSTHLAHLFTEIAAHPALAREPAPPKTPPLLPPFTPVVSSDPWPGHRPYYLPGLTRTALDAIPDKAEVLVILPTGAIEQHGPHLPVGVDAILGQVWLNQALPKLPTGTRVLVAPPITYGKSSEHIGFPGTLSISAKTLRRLVLATAQQLHALGFARFAVLNTHGGNSAVLVYTLREIQTSLGLQAGMISHGYPPPVSTQESTYGFHAGEWETSLMLAVAEDLVRMDQAVCEYPVRLDDPGELRPENAPATYSWITSDISISGVMGNPSVATREKGRRWLDEASTALARHPQLQPKKKPSV